MFCFSQSASARARSWLLRSLFLVSVASALLCPLHADTPEEPIRDLKKFWQLGDIDRDKPVVIDAEVSVDYYDPEWRLIWGRSGGMGHYFTSGDKPLPIEIGRTYRLQGTMAPSTGLTFAGARITLLPDTPPATPQDATSTITEVARLQNQIVRVEGTVQRQAFTDPHHQMIDVLVGETLVHARVYLHNEVPVPDVQDSVIRITGVYLAKTTQAGKIAQLELWVTGSESVTIVGRTIEDPRFTLPATAIEKVPFLRGDKPVRVVGTVRASEPGKFVSVRDRTGQIKVLTSQTRIAAIGQTVEAVGTPSSRGTDWSLHDGLFRPTGDIIDNQASSELRLAEQVLDLRSDEARRELSVKLTGIVTWVRGSTRYIYIQDASGGIRVQLPESFRPSRDMIFGMVEVIGVTASGAFAPEVVATRINQLGPTAIPISRLVTLDQALTGVEASQWVEMRGHLRAITHEDIWTQLSLISSSGEFTVKLPRTESLSQLMGAQVRVTGVCVVEANEHHELTGVSLLSPNADSIIVEDPAPPDAFSVPERTIASLRQFSPLQSFNRRVRLTAQVVHHVPGRYLYLRDGESGLLALTRDTTPLKSGDRVEVSGLPGREGNRLVLRESIYRQVGSGLPIAPFVPNEGRSLDETLDGRLVRLEGRLLEASRRGSSVHLLIQSARTVFEARAWRTPSRNFPPSAPNFASVVSTNLNSTSTRKHAVSTCCFAPYPIWKSCEVLLRRGGPRTFRRRTTLRLCPRRHRLGDDPEKARQTADRPAPRSVGKRSHPRSPPPRHHRQRQRLYLHARSREQIHLVQSSRRTHDRPCPRKSDRTLVPRFARTGRFLRPASDLCPTLRKRSRRYLSDAFQNR
ncbi:MAG: hypothetical protein QM760_22260 [Nibricoccus sp.]